MKILCRPMHAQPVLYYWTRNTELSSFMHCNEEVQVRWNYTAQFVKARYLLTYVLANPLAPLLLYIWKYRMLPCYSTCTDCICTSVNCFDGVKSMLLLQQQQHGIIVWTTCLVLWKQNAQLVTVVFPSLASSLLYDEPTCCFIFRVLHAGVECFFCATESTHQVL